MSVFNKIKELYYEAVSQFHEHKFDYSELTDYEKWDYNFNYYESHTRQRYEGGNAFAEFFRRLQDSLLV